MAKEKSNSTSEESSTRTNATDDATKAAKEIIQRHRKPSGAAQSNSVKAAAIQTELEEQQRRRLLLEEIERLYQPRAFKPIVSAPSNVLVLATGSDIWKLTDEEVENQSMAASISARYFLPVDPKWVALSMLFMSLATSYGTRAALYMKELRDEKRKKEEKQAS